MRKLPFAGGALIAGLLLAGMPGSPAAAAGARPGATKDCGIVTCSIYLSRSETQRAAADVLPHANDGKDVLTGLAALVCAPGGPVVAAACGINVALRSNNFIGALQGARDGHGCLRIRFGPGPGPVGVTAVVYGFYNDGGKHCHD